MVQSDGDTEEKSALFIVLSLVEWSIFLSAIPIFNVDLMYYPGWIPGLLGWLFFSYFLIEIGFLKTFY